MRLCTMQWCWKKWLRWHTGQKPSTPASSLPRRNCRISIITGNMGQMLIMGRQWNKVSRLKDVGRPETCFLWDVLKI